MSIKKWIVWLLVTGVNVAAFLAFLATGDIVYIGAMIAVFVAGVVVI